MKNGCIAVEKHWYGNCPMCSWYALSLPIVNNKSYHFQIFQPKIWKNYNKLILKIQKLFTLYFNSYLCVSQKFIRIVCVFNYLRNQNFLKISIGLDAYFQLVWMLNL
jgi:hypothetical protein